MLEPFSIVQLRQIVLDLVEDKYLKIKLPHGIGIKFLLLLTLNVFACKNV